MKYEFHVGDYVETKDGYTGYVQSFISSYNNDLKDDVVHLVCIEERNGKKRDDRLWVTSDIIPKHFKRIGQYDFTKKDEGKIEPLACETASDYSNEKLRKKINELVEAVNRLEEKVNEMV